MITLSSFSKPNSSTSPMEKRSVAHHTPMNVSVTINHHWNTRWKLEGIMRLHITIHPPLQPRVSVTVRFQFRQAPILCHPIEVNNYIQVTLLMRTSRSPTLWLIVNGGIWSGWYIYTYAAAFALSSIRWQRTQCGKSDRGIKPYLLAKMKSNKNNHDCPHRRD